MPLTRPEDKTVVQRYLPIVSWLPKYDWGGTLRFDILAGITIWALLVPEAMAYAGIAGVSPEIGLVTAPLALIGYAIFGSSKHLNVGPSSTVAILSASIVAPLAGSDADLYLVLTIWLAVVTGVMFVTLGLARMGWVANFMASSVLAGFMVGLAITIAVGQLDKIVGVEVEGENAIAELIDMFRNFSDWNWPEVIIGVAALAALFALHAFAPRLPAALIVMLVAIGLSAALNWEDGSIHVVGDIPATLPEIGLPEWPGWDLMNDIILGAFAVVIVGFAESYAAAKSYASRMGYRVDANQEMIGLGAGNLGAGLSGGFVVDGSLSKTAAGVSAGQKTQMTSIVAALFILITIVALTWLFEPLPEAVLGAIVIHAVWKLITFKQFERYWRQRKTDFILALSAFLGVILMDLLAGIVIGIILSLLALIYRASFPRGTELGRVRTPDGTYQFVDIENYDVAEVLAGVVVYRPGADLIFSNAEAFSARARELLWLRTDQPATLLIVDCEEMSDMDVTGAEELLGLYEELAAAKVDMWLARLHGGARGTAESTGVIETLGEERIFGTTREAGAAYRTQRGEPDWTDKSDGA